MSQLPSHNKELPYDGVPGRCNKCGKDPSPNKLYCKRCHTIMTDGTAGDDWLQGNDMSIYTMDEVEEVGASNLDWFGEW